MGKGIGWVDANLLAAVYQDSAKIWTRDRFKPTFAKYNYYLRSS